MSGLVQTDAVSKAVSGTRKSVTPAQTMSYRLGLSEDIAGVALFLASDKAAFINGAILLVDGGDLVHESSPRRFTSIDITAVRLPLASRTG